MIPGQRILFVDDEPDIVDVFALAARFAGFEAEGFSRPSLALDRFRSDPDSIAAVITDFTMAEMPCAEFIARLRQIRPDVPVHLCTGNAEHEIKEAARSLAVGKVIYKPFDFETLEAFLRDALRPGG